MKFTKSKILISIFIIFIAIVIFSIFYTKKIITDVPKLISTMGFTVTNVIRDENKSLSFNMKLTDKDRLNLVLKSGHLILFKKLPEYVSKELIESELDANIKIVYREGKSEEVNDIYIDILNSKYNKFVKNGMANIHIYFDENKKDVMYLEVKDIEINYKKYELPLKNLLIEYNNKLSILTYNLDKGYFSDGDKSYDIRGANITSGEDKKSYILKGSLDSYSDDLLSANKVKFLIYLNKSYKDKDYLVVTSKINIDKVSKNIVSLNGVNLDFLISFKDKNSILKIKSLNNINYNELFSKSVNILSNYSNIENVRILGISYGSLDLRNLKVFNNGYDYNIENYIETMKVDAILTSNRYEGINMANKIIKKYKLEYIGKFKKVCNEEINKPCIEVDYIGKDIAPQQ